MSKNTPNGLSRRHFLTLAGGGIVLAAGITGTVFSLTRTPHTALAPWAQAGQYDEPRRFALSYALLAPNPHNLQPWIVDLQDDGFVTLYKDPERSLPETDPFDRQITIGLGCFLEQMSIAATAAGYRTEASLFPEGESDDALDERPVARVRFIASDIQTDPLFNHILNRRSTKEPFDMEKPVNAGQLVEINPEVAGVRFAGTVDTQDVESLRALTWDAWMAEYTTPGAMQESIDLMRLGKAEINANPDGIDIGGMPLEALIVAGAVTRKGLATPGSISYQAGIDMYKPMLAATPAFVWLTSNGNARVDQITTGRAWLRTNLNVTRQGLALHPVSQCLQEYPEMAPHYLNVHRMLAQTGETVQMLGRLGYAAPVPQTPRWSLDAKIKTT